MTKRSKEYVLKIKPNDTLFFRDGKPFDAGENMWLGSHTMPSPSVFYGAIFSAILSQNPECRKDILDKELKETLELDRVYIYDEKSNEFYMPCPRDLFKSDSGKVRFGKIRDDGLTYRPSDSFDNIDNEYISVLNFVNSYAKNRDFSISLISEDKIFVNSYKVGIKKELKKGVAKDDHLYRIDMVEFNDLEISSGNTRECDWNYVVECRINDSKLALDDKGLLKLGGRGKSCKYEILEDKPYTLEKLAKYSDGVCQTNKVKMVLTSLGIYEKGGFRPTFCDNSIELNTAITGKPIYIGGFDVKIKYPKPMYRAVPSGSIYILESSKFEGKSIREIKKHIKESVTDNVDSFKGFNNFEIVPYYGG